MHHQIVHRGDLALFVEETDEIDGAEAGLPAIALDTLHASRLVVARPDDTWYGADRGGVRIGAQSRRR